MEFLVKAAGDPRRVGVLAGSFHPITRAHEALAQSALTVLDEVVLAMPRRFPHKEYERVGLADRMALVSQVAQANRGLSAAITEGGLFIDMAREARAVYGPEAEFWFLCGRDAAERIIGWDYSGDRPIEEQLREFGLLVADRQGRFEAPLHLSHRVMRLELTGEWNDVSATEVRRRIAERSDWRELVPTAVADRIDALYA